MKITQNSKAQLVDYPSEEWLGRRLFCKDYFPHQRFLQLFYVLHPNPPLATPNVHPRGTNPVNISKYTDKKGNESIKESTVGLKGKIQ
jgi:hypothetical protein